MNGSPELSVVTIAGIQRARVQRTIDAVGNQIAAESVELVVVDIAPESGSLRLPEDRKSVV